MNITLNITPAVRQTLGIGTYAKELTLAILGLDKDNDYTLFFSRNPFSRKARFDLKFLKDNRTNLRSIALPYWVLNFLWNELGMFPVENVCGECDIFHSLDMLAPITKRAKLVTTVHDVTWLIFDDNAPFSKEDMRKEVASSLKRSRIVIADSFHTKKELSRYFPFLTDDKVVVIHLGISGAFRPIPKDDPLIVDGRKRYGWGDFIFYIGELDKERKNIRRLIEAYSILKRRKHIQEKLVLCGKASKAILKLINELKINNDVIVYGDWIADEDIPTIYNMAKALVYPSLYEGFGLPILEAMACGKPVITSRLTSIPEVAGDAAYYVDPYDVDDIAKGIEEVLTDSKLYFNLVERGLGHAKKYTWRHTAAKTLELYKKIS